VAQRQGIAVALAVALLLGGCGEAAAAPSPSPTYHVNQEWVAAPGWRLKVTGMRCGVRESDPDAGEACLVAVAFTNVGDRARTFSGTADEAGPTWRLVGYDAQAREFHGHGRLEPPTDPGAAGTTELVFEVPAHLRLVRVLLGDVLVVLDQRR
jgi:hypothetical protein